MPFFHTAAPPDSGRRCSHVRVDAGDAGGFRRSEPPVHVSPVFCKESPFGALTKADRVCYVDSCLRKVFLPGDTMPYHTVLPARKLRAER